MNTNFNSEYIQKERVEYLNQNDPTDGDCVLYWMQSSQRTEYNHALEYSIELANERNENLIVFFGLTDSFPMVNRRHYKFMLEGLSEVEDSLEERGIKFVIKAQEPVDGVIEMADEASVLVVDKEYLKIGKNWRSEVSSKIDCPMIQVESDVIVPVETASEKEEYAARTLRPKIQEKLKKFLVPVKKLELKKDSLDFDFQKVDLDDVDGILNNLDIDQKVEGVSHFIGGFGESKAHLNDFLKNRLDLYPECGNDPSKNCLSNLSPYLHFGQISPIYIALKVKEKGGPGVEDYLEQLIVRRELAINYVHYNESYDSLEGLPDWAKETLGDHDDDEREYLYSRSEFENANTHDPYWNAAQTEMAISGKMHGYMRIYWGKKILEWSDTVEEAFETAIYLNNKYELDVRDPNGYTGVAWCFGKHDRAWKERPIYGKVRYMSSSGLERKFDMDKYVDSVENLREI